MNIGTIINWGSENIPQGWLLCNGSEVSRTTYKDLFDVIGTNYGEGDGSTTFNLPDLRGKVAVGKSNETEFNELGKVGGEKTHTLTINEMPAHTHNTTALNQSSSGTAPTNINPDANCVLDYASCYQLTEKGWSNRLAMANRGGDQAHNNLQPYQVLNYIIKASIGETRKISELNELTTPLNSDVLPIVNSGETKKIKVENLVPRFQYMPIIGLRLVGGDTYKLELPNNAIFVEPLIICAGSQTAGGTMVTIGGGYVYCNNIDNPQTSDKGIWLSCDYDGLVTISNYKHSGNTIAGFRIWYFG